jgi:hypothetical protein
LRVISNKLITVAELLKTTIPSLKFFKFSRQRNHFLNRFSGLVRLIERQHPTIQVVGEAGCISLNFLSSIYNYLRKDSRNWAIIRPGNSLNKGRRYRPAEHLHLTLTSKRAIVYTCGIYDALERSPK